ncbi:MAG: hypothetical protein ACKO37_09405 [Vampirovibrionales bacterium]
MFSDDLSLSSPFKLPAEYPSSVEAQRAYKQSIRQAQRAPKFYSTKQTPTESPPTPLSLKTFHPKTSLWSEGSTLTFSKKSTSTGAMPPSLWHDHTTHAPVKKSSFQLPASFKANVPHAHEVVKHLPSPLPIRHSLENFTPAGEGSEKLIPFQFQQLPTIPWEAVQRSIQALSQDTRFQKKQLTGWGLQRDDLRIWMQKLFSPRVGFTDKMHLLTQIPMSQATRSLFASTLRQFEKDKTLNVSTTMSLLKKLSPETQGGTVAYETLLTPPKQVLKHLSHEEKNTLHTLQSQPELLKAVASIDGHPEALGIEDIWLASFSQAQLRFTPERVHQLQTLLIPVTAWHETHATLGFENVLTHIAQLLPTPFANRLTPSTMPTTGYPPFLKPLHEVQPSLISQGIPHHIWEALNLEARPHAQLSPLEKQWLLDLQKPQVLAWLSPLSVRPNELSIAALRAYWMLRHLSPDELPEALLSLEPLGEEESTIGRITHVRETNPQHQRRKHGHANPEQSPEDAALMSDGLTPADLLALVDIVERFGGRMMYAQLIAYRPQNEDERHAIYKLLNHPLTHHALAQGDGNPEDITIQDLQIAFRKHLMLWMGPKRLRQLYQR